MTFNDYCLYSENETLYTELSTSVRMFFRYVHWYHPWDFMQLEGYYLNMRIVLSEEF